MLHTAETYVEHLTERAMEFANEPYIAFEVKVDISDYVPEAFGRCDCVMFGERYPHHHGLQARGRASRSAPTRTPSSCCTRSAR